MVDLDRPYRGGPRRISVDGDVVDRDVLPMLSGCLVIEVTVGGRTTEAEPRRKDFSEA